MTSGKIAVHLAEVYGAEVSRQTISTITSKPRGGGRGLRDAALLAFPIGSERMVSPPGVGCRGACRPGRVRRSRDLPRADAGTLIRQGGRRWGRSGWEYSTLQVSWTSVSCRPGEGHPVQRAALVVRIEAVRDLAEVLGDVGGLDPLEERQLTPASTVRCREAVNPCTVAISGGPRYS